MTFLFFPKETQAWNDEGKNEICPQSPDGTENVKNKKHGRKSGSSAKEEAETSRSPESVKGLFVPHSAGVSAAHSQCLARA